MAIRFRDTARGCPTKSRHRKDFGQAVSPGLISLGLIEAYFGTLVVAGSPTSPGLISLGLIEACNPHLRTHPPRISPGLISLGLIEAYFGTLVVAGSPTSPGLISLGLIEARPRAKAR